MTRKQYDEQLLQLGSLLEAMGELNGEAIGQCVRALEEQDASLAQSIKQLETQVDEKEQQIERLCLRIIVRQQPVAGDLMFVTGAMKMVTDMERIADQAADIGALVVKMRALPYAESPKEIAQMAERVRDMVCMSAQAFSMRSADLAKEVCRADDAVDDLFDVVKHKLTGILHKDIDDDANGEQALDMLMIAKYLEKIGDHAANIAEWVLFMLTGELKKLN